MESENIADPLIANIAATLPPPLAPASTTAALPLLTRPQHGIIVPNSE